MPELPEVETVKRALDTVMQGRRLARVDVRRRDLRFPLPADFESRLTGRRILSLDRRAKYIRAKLDDGTALILHLGMTGAFVYNDATVESPHDHIRFTLDNGARLTFRDARRFGFMDLTETAKLEHHPLFRHLGPEPLDEAFDGPVLAARLKGKTAPIKTALMDQRVVAGLGNIYVCEALYRADISPRRRAGTVTSRRAARLATNLKETLLDAIAAGGTSFRDYVSPSGQLGDFGLQAGVYGRAGMPCPRCSCDKGIQRIIQAGRSTFFCPVLQR